MDAFPLIKQAFIFFLKAKIFFSSFSSFYLHRMLHMFVFIFDLIIWPDYFLINIFNQQFRAYWKINSEVSMLKQNSGYSIIRNFCVLYFFNY